MNLFATLPALVRIAIVFAVIILALRNRVSLANAFLGGTILLALLFAMPPAPAARSALSALLAPRTVTLCIIVALILILSNSLETCGQMQRLLKNFQILVKNPRLSITAFPLLIGLLPMPGGAVFSAPMVKEIGSRSELSPATLSYINYWFRHIWEYWWPMYPGVLLATSLADMNLLYFIAVMFPFTLLVFGLGWLPIRVQSLAVPDGGEKTAAAPSAAANPVLVAAAFFRELAPILLVIVLGLTLGGVITALWPALPVAKEIGLILSLGAGVLLVWKTNHFPVARCRAMATNPQVLKMVYMVAAILLFKQILDDSGAVNRISAELVYLRVPLLLICVLLPFIIGLLTGITIAFVGSTFPLLLSLINPQHSETAIMAYLMVGLTCGFTGVLLSPVHLCLLLSNQFFETTLRPVYRHLWLPCTGIILASLAYFAILS